MLAPTFEKGQHRDVKHVVLSHKLPLPFTKDSRLNSDDAISQGGHSTVFKVEIHPNHHNFNTTMVSDSLTKSPLIMRYYSIIPLTLRCRKVAVVATALL